MLKNPETQIKHKLSSHDIDDIGDMKLIVKGTLIRINLKILKFYFFSLLNYRITFLMLKQNLRTKLEP